MDIAVRICATIWTAQQRTHQREKELPTLRLGVAVDTVLLLPDSLARVREGGMGSEQQVHSK